MTGFASVILFQVLHCNLIIQKLLMQYPVASLIAKYGQMHTKTNISKLILRKKNTPMYIFVQEACLPFAFLSIRILTVFLMQHSKYHSLIALSFVTSSLVLDLYCSTAAFNPFTRAGKFFCTV